MKNKLAIQLLGEFCIAYNDQPLSSCNTPRLQSLLAYLILHHDIPQPRRQLAYLIWPDSSESSARNNLRQLIYQLRQALPDPDRFITGDANIIGWKLDGNQSIDVIQLEHTLAQATQADKQQNEDLQLFSLHQAAQLFHGDLLPGCYDEWVFPERDRIRAEVATVLQKLMRLQEERRDYPAAIHTGQALLRLDPLNEATVLFLMRLFQFNQDPSGALRLYQETQENLERELAVSPGQTLRQEYERLSRNDMHSTTLGKPANPSRREALVGRQAEWQKLRAAWQKAAVGHPSLAVISGEAGIGKTRLAEEMTLWAEQQGIVTARAHAYGIEGQLTFAPVTEWLRSIHFSSLPGALEPVWLTEISRLLPELRTVHNNLRQPEPITEYGQRQKFFEALSRAVLSSGQPILLVLDDLQWCDMETIEWLHFLLRFDPQAPMLVLGTLRSEEPSPVVDSLIQQLTLSKNITVIELQPLDASETARLAGQMEGKELSLEETLKLYHETEGNPLFVVEMIHAGFYERLPGQEIDPGEGEQPVLLPPRVQAVILQRLAQLSPSARRAAEAGAVYGQPFNHELLVQVEHAGEDDIVRDLDELWRRRIIREQTANMYEFSHDKLREGAYNEISAPQRRLLHRRVAQALETLNQANLEPVSGQIAAHYDRSGAPDKAIPYYLTAGAAATSIYANDDAIALLKRGLELLPQLSSGTERNARELSLLSAIIPLYRITQGWTAPDLGRALNRALVLCDQVGTSEQRAQILYGLQSAFVVEGRLEKVQFTFEEMRRLFLQTQGSVPQFAGLMYTGARLHMGYFVEAREAFDRIIASQDDARVRDLQDSQGVNYLAHAHAWNAHALWFLGCPDSALQGALHGVKIAQEYAQPFNQALTATYLAMLQELCSDHMTFQTQAQEALRLCREYRAPYYQQWAQILVDFASACSDPSTACLACLEEDINLFIQNGVHLRLPYYLSLLARAYHQVGDHARALAVIERAISEALNNLERCWDAELHRLRGDFLLAQSDSGAEASAESAYKRSLEIARSQEGLSFELRAAVSLARLWQAQRRGEQGKQLIIQVLSRFSEGQESPEVHSAKSLLQAFR